LFLSCGQTMRREPYFLLNCWRSSLIPLARCFIQTRCRRRKDPDQPQDNRDRHALLVGAQAARTKRDRRAICSQRRKVQTAHSGGHQERGRRVARRTRRQSSAWQGCGACRHAFEAEQTRVGALRDTLNEVWSSGSAIASLTAMSRTGCQTRPISHLSTSMVRRSCLT